jgi:DNA-binding PucR family transcriptional regulator
VIAAKGGALRDGATVRAYAAADMNVARAAERLHVHPNTVRNRLGRIAVTTGHDPRTFAGLVELLCIVELARDTVG